jgi:hypothetical protein
MADSSLNKKMRWNSMNPATLMLPKSPDSGGIFTSTRWASLKDSVAR